MGGIQGRSGRIRSAAGLLAQRCGVRMRLTYANVTATVALFLALGGTTMAAVSTISGSQIRNHSIPVSKLVRGAVVPHARVANTVKQLVLSKGKFKHRKRRHGLRVADASSSSTTTSGTLTTMSLGQTLPVLTVGPFTITAKCFAPHQYNETAALSLYATANVDGWYGLDTSNFNGGPWKAGQVIELWEDGAQGSDIRAIPAGNTQPNLPLVSPDGTIVTIGGTATWNQVSDCAVSLFAIT